MSKALMILSPRCWGLSSAAVVGSASAMTCSLSHAACSSSAVIRDGPSATPRCGKFQSHILRSSPSWCRQAGLLTEAIAAALALADEVLERGDDVALVHHLVLGTQLLEPFKRARNQLQAVLSPAKEGVDKVERAGCQPGQDSELAEKAERARASGGGGMGS